MVSFNFGDDFGEYEQSSFTVRENAVQNALQDLSLAGSDDDSELIADESFVPYTSGDYSMNAGNVSINGVLELKQGFFKAEKMALTQRNARLDGLFQLTAQEHEEVDRQSQANINAIYTEFMRVDAVRKDNTEKRSRLALLIRERLRREQEEEAQQECERREEENRQKRLAEERRLEEEEEKKRTLRLAESQRKAEVEKRVREEAALKAKREQEEQLEKERQEKSERIRKEKEEADRKAAAEREAKAKALAAQRSSQSAYTDWSNVEKEFKSYKTIIQDMKDLSDKVASNKPLKSYCFNQRTAMRPKLGQLTTSNKHVLQIAGEIDQILSTVQRENPEVYLFIANHFAKFVVKQAEVEIVANVQQAIPLGMMTANVMARHPEICDVMIARFVKRAPQIIGYSCAIDTEEKRKDMAWKKEGDKWEPEATYLERISAICQVWTVITISSVEQSGLAHPYTISHSWKFLARHANKPATQAADYHAVAAWWEIACKDFVKAYGKQANKLLKLICTDWTDNKTNGAAQRLNIMGEDWAKTGSLTTSWEPLSA